MNEKKLEWINCAKLLAMCAVCVDHTHFGLYTNRLYASISYFSVTCFVFLSGMSTYLSQDKKGAYSIGTLAKKVFNLLSCYGVAVAAYLITTKGYFSLGEWYGAFIGFATPTPSYFIVFYLQLILVSPLLFRAILLCKQAKHSLISKIVLLIVCYAAAIACTLYTSLPYFGGGAYLFGGSYLLVFCLGMLSVDFFTSKFAQKLCTIPVAIISLVPWAAMAYYVAKGGYMLSFPFAPWQVNPPGIALIIYGVMTIWLCFVLTNILLRISKPTKLFVKAISFAGGYTLDIFLYHVSIYLLLMGKFAFLLTNLPMRIIFFATLVLVPIAGRYIYNLIKCRLKKAEDSYFANKALCQ